MTPTLGRIVLFRFGAHENARNRSRVHPAIIACVHSPTMVNLRVFCDGDEIVWATSVRLAEAEPVEHTSERVCWWPPRVA